MPTAVRTGSPLPCGLQRSLQYLTTQQTVRRFPLSHHLLLGIYPEKHLEQDKGTCALGYSPQQFVTAKHWEQPECHTNSQADMQSPQERAGCWREKGSLCKVRHLQETQARKASKMQTRSIKYNMILCARQKGKKYIPISTSFRGKKKQKKDKPETNKTLPLSIR